MTWKIVIMSHVPQLREQYLCVIHGCSSSSSHSPSFEKSKHNWAWLISLQSYLTTRFGSLLKKSIKLGAELLPACTNHHIIIHHVPEDDVAAAAVTAAEFQLFAIGIIIITLSTSSSFYAAATTTTTTITVPS